MPIERPSWHRKHTYLFWTIVSISFFLVFDLVITAVAGPGIWTLPIILIVHVQLLLVLIVIYINWSAMRIRAGAPRRWTGSRWYNWFEFTLFVIGLALAMGSLVVTMPLVLVLSLLSVAVIFLVVFAYILVKSRKGR